MRVPGIIKLYQGKEITLELTYSSENKEKIFTEISHDLILGTSPDGQLITLYKCSHAEHLTSLHSLEKATFEVDIVFIGVHFERKEDIKFNQLFIYYLYLYEWARISSLETRFLPHKKGEIAKYERLKSIQMADFKDFKIFLGLNPLLIREPKKINIEENAYIGIRAPKGIYFEEYLDIIYAIQSFLSFAVSSGTHPSGIAGITNTRSEVSKNGEQVYYSINIICSPKIIRFASEEPIPNRMLFTFKDMNSKQHIFLENWLNKEDLLKPVYDLYLTQLYEPFLHKEQIFLNLALAIESYHRRTMNNFELSIQKHAKRINEIIKSTPCPHKKWLEQKLNYSNELSFRGRIKDILRRFNKISKCFIGDKKSFIQKVVVTRNYLVHLDKALKGKSAKGKELHNLNQKIKILIELCFLREIGFAPVKIRKLILEKYWSLFIDFPNLDRRIFD